MRIEGQLDVGTQSLLQRAIREARSSDAKLLVELDTPGGEVQLMWQLAGQIDEASGDGVETVAWVNDHAASAGALVAMACERIYMRSQASIGSSMPVVVLPNGSVGSIPDEALQEKEISFLRSSFRAWAESHRRPPALAEAMVDSDVGVKQVRLGGELRLVTVSEYEDLQVRGEPFELVSTVVEEGKLLALSGAQAVELGLADGLAESLSEACEKIGASPAELRKIERTRSEDTAAFLDRIKYLLLLGGIVAAYLEFKAPGFGLPGIASLACFGLFLFGRYLVGLADVPHIVAVALGVVLIAVELFALPGTIWFGLAGGVLVLAGLVLAVTGIDSGLEYALDRRYALDAAFQLVLWVAAAVAIAWGLARVLPHTPFLSRLVLDAPASTLSGEAVPEAGPPAERRRLAGALGTALTDLRPVGKVALDSAPALEYEARALGPAIDRGARVRVAEVQSARLGVELAQAPANGGARA